MVWGRGPEFETIKEWTCECCGKKATLSAKEAHLEGWDTPPYFTGYVKCMDCPITSTALWMIWTEFGEVK